MRTLNTLKKLLLLALATITLLSGQETQPVPQPGTSTHVIGGNVIRTITIGNDAYAITEVGGAPFRLWLTGGVTKAFGIANGKLAYSVDEDLFILDLSTSQRTQILRGSPVLNCAWSPDGARLAVAIRTGNGVNLQAVTLDEGPATLLYANNVLSDVVRWMPDGTLVFAAEEAPEATMLIHRSPEGALSAKRIRRESVPLLAVTTDADLSGVEPERSIERWNNLGRIPLAITETGYWAQSDSGEIEFRTADGGAILPQSDLLLLSKDVRAATSLPSFGTLLGDYDGVSSYSNGTASNDSKESNYVVQGQTQTYIGEKWQCVEFVRRYYFSRFGLDLAAKFRGDAHLWWDGAAAMNLDRFSNGGSTPPEPGDILVSTGTTANVSTREKGNLGHVAIVRSRDGNSVCTANQNWSNTAEQLNRCLTLRVNAGQYTVDGLSVAYPTTGWLRRRSTTTAVKAEVISPAQGGTLVAATQTFVWSPGQNVTTVFLYVGTTTGANDLYGASQGANRTVTVTNLPTDGRTLYVRLWSAVNGSWLFADYQFRAASISQGSGAKAEMISPAAGSTLAGAAQSFVWGAGQNVSSVFLYVGTTAGANDLYGASQGTNRTVTVSNLPTDGRTLYVRLFSSVNGSWLFSDYQYGAASISQGSGAKAQMTSPAPGSTLAGATQTFSWTAGQNVAQYFFYVGTTVGGNNLYGASTGTSRTLTVNNLPTDARTLYVRLWSSVNGSWQFADYSYRAATR